MMLRQDSLRQQQEGMKILKYKSQVNILYMNLKDTQHNLQYWYRVSK